MNRIKELYIFITNNLVITIMKVIILCCILSLVFLFLLFSRDLSSTDNDYQDIYSNKNFYQMIDNLDDSQSFYQFRQSEASMKSLKVFYDSLELNPTFDYLTTFDQPIKMRINDFKGGEHFKYSEDFEENGKHFAEVKSLQLNKKAYNMYKLNISDGKGFDWEGIDYSGKKIPVLLGANYEPFFRVGDSLKGEFYFNKYDFEIVGFLQKNTTLFYNNEINFCIDDHIVLPYPINGYEKLDQRFRGILYFAMINGNIVTHNKGDNIDKVLNDLSNISKSTGFSNYMIMGIPELTVQYHTIITMIKENRILTLEILMLFILFGIFIIGSIVYFIFKRRIGVYFAYMKLGYTKKEIQGLIFQDLSPPYIISALILVLYYHSQQILFLKGAISIILLDILLLLIMYLYTLLLLKKTNQTFNLERKENDKT